MSERSQSALDSSAIPAADGETPTQDEPSTGGAGRAAGGAGRAAGGAGAAEPPPDAGTAEERTEHAVEDPTGPAASAAAEEFQEACRQNLETVFGFPSFRDGQVDAVTAVGRGTDALVIMPTGSGKSLCYQIPALTLPGTALVVSPLIALMKDQVDSLRLRGASVACIHSGMQTTEVFACLDALRAGQFKLVYVAPERFRSRSFRRALAQVNVSLLAVDEAHCISQWGHDFRPDYRRLREVRERLNGVPTIALTATATPEVQEDIVRELEMDSPVRVITGFDRPNLAYQVHPIRSGPGKNEILKETIVEALRDHDGDGLPAGIVYVGTRRHAEEVAEVLNEHQWQGETIPDRVCRAYHAGLDASERREVQEDFMEGRLPWVAATNAFGMGVDKADIRNVVHYDLPGSVEAYYQEVGRAGRDGLPATCSLLFAERDRRLQEFFIEGANPSREFILHVHDFLWHLGENPIFRSLHDLQDLFEITMTLAEKPNPLAFRSAIVVLERAGALERLDHYDNLAEVRQTPNRAWTVDPYANKAPVKAALWTGLQNVFEQNGGEPASLALGRWAPELDLTEDSLKRAIAGLVEDGWIEYTPPFRGRAIRLTPKQEARGDLAVDFNAIRKRREREEQHLAEIISFARSRQCRRDSILRYFGEEIPDETCGRCDSCRGPGAGRVGQGGTPATPRPLSARETLVVRKLLSGVARARGRCGRNRIIQMLRGSRAQSMREFGFETLSTYGLLRSERTAALRDLLDHLETAGCVQSSGDRFPLVHLTEKGREVMADRTALLLPLRHESTAPPGDTRQVTSDEEPYDEDLFQTLRHLRRELATEHEVPAFRVFADRTLKAMARARPQSEAELLALPGVGQVTLDLFGTRFLEVLREESGGS